MSWLRDWLNRGKQTSDQSSEASDAGERAGEHQQEGQTVHIRDAERRQLRRLLTRHENLSYDLRRAEEALETENQWTERIEQLNQAIEQAQSDRQTLEPRERPEERPQLGPLPVEIAAIRETEPAEITLRLGEVELRYSEEIDWAERGHQVTIPELRRVDGDVDPLMPDLDSSGVTQELREHLRHSLATYANQALEHAAAGTEPPPLTLADITRPCPHCGGWLDQKGRCPQCTEIEWKRQQIDADLRRLRKERDEVIQDLERQQERLPIIRRQLAETESDIEKLRAKGVEPAG